MTAISLPLWLADCPWEYRVVHHTPGRLRLRLPQLARNPRLAERLETFFAAWPQISAWRINPAAASVVLRYGAEEPALARPPRELSPLALPLTATLLALAKERQDGLPLTLAARSALALAAWPVARRALASLWRDRKFNIDCLDLLALILSAGQGKLLTPALVITLHELGDWIRERTARATETQTLDLLETLGRFAWVEREGAPRQIPSDQVKVGETVLVYPGERIPVDGRVTEGEATVDQQQLTGESMPIVAQPGTLVYAATLLRSGRLRIHCERVGAQTRAAASLELLAKAPVRDTRMANYAARLADRLILPSLGLAVIVWGLTKDPARAAAILTLDFVTGIRVSLPTAFLGALNHTTRHGILVRSGRTLELLAQVDAVVFDKTGTLTQGNIQVTEIQTASAEIAPQRVLQLAASAEQRLTHPVAEAIVRRAQEEGLELLPRRDWQYQVGAGVSAEIDGGLVLVGSDKFLREQGVTGLGVQNLDPRLSVVQVARDGAWLGTLYYADPLRPESAALAASLQRDYGLEVHLLTGDIPQRALPVARALGIPPTQVHAEAFPEDKAKIVRELSRAGRVVAFAGDGLNDSVALAYADVSISFADSSEIARETADVVLMNNDLSSLKEAFNIARDTQALIEQNTLLVVLPNLLGLGLAATTGLNPLLATVIHNGAAIAAGLNSLRPLLQHQLEQRLTALNPFAHDPA